MKIMLLSTLATIAITAGGAAIAADAPPPPPGARHALFEEFDANKDGVVTRAEVKAAFEKRFAELDTDHNGVVTDAERKAEREKMRTERFNQRFDAMDTDKNGQLSREELRAAHGPRGERPDAGGPNGDAPPPPPPPGAGPEGKDGPDGGPRFGHGWGHGYGGGVRGGMGPRGGGDMTKEQFLARPLQLFDTIDSNHDGKISPAERDAATALMHPRFPDAPPPPADAPPRK